MNDAAKPNILRVLVACEFSGRVRDAFLELGHDAFSCDFLKSEAPRGSRGRHFQRDVLGVLAREDREWDLLIAHPPCTHLSVSGARWWKDKEVEQKEAVEFFMALIEAPIPRIAVENPIGLMSTVYRKPDQIIQPWQFGHGETKATCLWLKNLPKLEPTNIVEGREPKVHHASPGPDRWKIRSLTYQGIADAMARQWGGTT